MDRDTVWQEKFPTGHYMCGCTRLVVFYMFFFTFLIGEPKKVAQFKLPLKGECVKG